MASRSTIGRSMLAMLVIGFGLAWGRCWLKEENWPGEFGPMVILSHFALAFSILSHQRQRRFWLGTVVVGLGISLGFFFSSGSFRASTLMSWIVPLERRLEIERSRTFDEGNLIVTASEMLIIYDRAGRPKLELPDQMALGLLELPLALIGGLSVAMVRRKSPASSPPSNLANVQSLVLSRTS